MNTRHLWIALATLSALGIAVAGLAAAPPKASPAVDAKHAAPKGAPSKTAAKAGVGRLELSEDEWRTRLSPEQFHILREEGTERAFTGKYWDTKERGVYVCAGCGLELFRSNEKYDSGTGWPSYWKPVDPAHVRIVKDTILGFPAEEVECARCGGHQGHVFGDGPRPTGLRYCINSASLVFVPAAAKEGAAAKK